MLVNKILLSSIVGLAAAQFPPKREGFKVVKSKHHDKVSISYKEPGLCESTPNVKSYSGYVHLPPGTVHEDKQDYPINTFFWFFEARHDPENAPLAIWLNGGPGSSSMLGLLQENGPCFIAEDSKSTIHNPWSWNNHVNMIYIDEPNQVGFSYDIPTNVTINIEEGEVVPTDFSSGIPEVNVTHRIGTMSSQKQENTIGLTEQAAHAMWHFAQTFFTEFPHYKPKDDRISLWAESYGGHYGPAFMRFFQQQNEKIRDGKLDDEHAHELHLDTLGIVNGCIDPVIREESGLLLPYNNTYGIPVLNQSTFDAAWHNFTKPGGCKEQMVQCQKELKKAKGELFTAQEKEVMEYCSLTKECYRISETVFAWSDNGRFDMAHPKADPFPPPHQFGWLIEEGVLSDLGVPVNFSASSSAVWANFERSGDQLLGFIDAIGYLLDSGIKVHMMYGDRDYACNWLGGEMTSLQIPHAHKDDFSKAGYAEVMTHDGFGGMARQYGNLSFTRVFQAGHEVPMYVPATAYDIFMRAMFNKDIATGKIDVHDEYATEGPDNTWHIKQAPPEFPKPKCYVLAPESCTEDIWEKVKAGKAIIKDYFVVGFTDEEDSADEL